MRTVWCLVLFLVFPALAQVGAADHKLRLYFLHLPPLIDAKGETGALLDALHLIGERAKVDFDFYPIPLPRAIRAIEEGEQAALVPQLDTMIPLRFKSNVQKSIPIVFKISYAFTRTGNALPKTLDDFKQKLLITTPTNPLPPQLDKVSSFEILETHSLVSAITLISKGRGDYFISDFLPTLHVIEREKIPNISYDTSGLHFLQPAHIVFSNTVDPALIKMVNTAIMSLVEDGTLKRIMPENFVQNYAPYIAAN